MPAAPRSRPGSYPVKPAACHPFLKEGEVCNAASTYPNRIFAATPRGTLVCKFRAEGRCPPASISSISSIHSIPTTTSNESTESK